MDVRQCINLGQPGWASSAESLTITPGPATSGPATSGPATSGPATSGPAEVEPAAAANFRMTMPTVCFVMTLASFFKPRGSAVRQAPSGALSGCRIQWPAARACRRDRPKIVTTVVLKRGRDGPRPAGIKAASSEKRIPDRRGAPAGLPVFRKSSEIVRRGRPYIDLQRIHSAPRATQVQPASRGADHERYLGEPTYGIWQ